MNNCSKVGEEASSNSSKSQTPYEDSDKKGKPKQRLLVPSAESFCTVATKAHGCRHYTNRSPRENNLWRLGYNGLIIGHSWNISPFQETNTQKIAATNGFCTPRKKSICETYHESFLGNS
jgi:hypothetical protein